MHVSLSILRPEPAQPFDRCLADHGFSGLQAAELSTLQVNLGKRCNQACRHCHVDAGPDRTEQMAPEIIEAVLDILRRRRIDTLDITGGAPEIHPQFRYLAAEARRLCRRVIDRSNLTIFFEPGHHDLPQFLADHRIEITASLPCYQMDNVDRQRGTGVFDKSIAALRRLNDLGYGRPGSDLVLNLVYNPVGAHLPPPQAGLQQDYQRQLADRFGIRFNRLYTITNMPISRFRRDLERSGQLQPYMDLLRSAFNPQTVEGLMCRSLISVSWDGYLYDCDFNQMLDLKVNHGMPQHIRDFDHRLLSRRSIRTDSHCYGCTAGGGSSCGGAVLA